MADDTVNGLGLGQGMAGGAAYDMLMQLLKNRFADQQENDKMFVERAKLAHDDNVATESAREYNVTQGDLMNRFQTDQSRQNSEFAAGAPYRAAQTANVGANTDHTKWEMSDAKRAADLSDAQARQKAATEGQLRVTGAEGANTLAAERLKETDLRTRPIQVTGPDGHELSMIQLDPTTNQYGSVPVPAGLAPKGSPTSGLKGPQADEIAQYNSVIREGTRIMDALHRSGLDQDNSLLKARGRDFVARSLKVSTNDPLVDEMMQNVGYLQANALQAAGRGQRLTKPLLDLLAPHIGSTDTSGSRLATLLPQLIKETAARRADVLQGLRASDPGILSDDRMPGVTADDGKTYLQNYLGVHHAGEGPKQGDTKTFPNGTVGVYDGTGWVKK